MRGGPASVAEPMLEQQTQPVVDAGPASIIVAAGFELAQRGDGQPAGLLGLVG